MPYSGGSWLWSCDGCPSLASTSRLYRRSWLVKSRPDLPALRHWRTRHGSSSRANLSRSPRWLVAICNGPRDQFLDVDLGAHRLGVGGTLDTHHRGARALRARPRILERTSG